MKPVFIMGLATLGLLGYLLAQGDLPTQQASAQAPTYQMLVESAARAFGGVPRSVEKPSYLVASATEATVPLAVSVSADAAVVTGIVEDSPPRESAEGDVRELSARAVRLLSAGKYVEAREIAGTCLRIDSTNLNCQKSAINSYILAGESELAAPLIGLCVANHPEDPFCLAQRDIIAEARPVATHQADPDEHSNEERPQQASIE